MTCAATSLPTTPRGLRRPIHVGTTVVCCYRFRACSSWRRGRCASGYSVPKALALHPHLGRDRAGVAHVLVVVDLVAAFEVVEVAGQQRVAVEVEQATLFGQQESEILFRRDLGNLTQRLVFGIVVADLCSAIALLFEVEIGRAHV